MPGTVHLVGSMVFDSAESTMRAVARAAGDTVDWVPDGETGDRMMWLTQHQQRFATTPGLAVRTAANLDARVVAGRIFYGLADGVTPETATAPQLGYAEHARESFAVFTRLQSEGVIAPDARFMVAIPTPLAFTASFIHPEEQEALAPLIERAVRDEIDAICRAIPHHLLALQWDVAIEFGVLEGVLPAGLPADRAAIVDRLVHIATFVPPDVPLAYHLCYGAPYDVHMIEPPDTGLMVAIADELLRRAGRPVDRLHLPVPLERDDLAFFAPLAGLAIDSGTALFLGLAHHEDGLDGGRRRIAAAKHYVDEFGVATECGSGRTAADPVALLRLQAQLAEDAARPRDESIDVPAEQVHEALDTEASNERLRAFTTGVACPDCSAPTNAPCTAPDGTPTVRPHYRRYAAALGEYIPR